MGITSPPSSNEAGSPPRVTRLRPPAPELIAPPAFARLRVARLHVTLRPRAFTPLRGLVAPSLRGMFGHALASAGGLAAEDLFQRVFINPPPPPGKRDQPPPAYLVDGASEPIDGVEGDTPLDLGLTLIGDAIPFALDVLWALDRYGRTQGLTEDRVPFAVERAVASTPVGPVVLFGEAPQRLPQRWEEAWTWTGDRLISHLCPPLRHHPGRISVRFETPLDIRENTPSGARQRQDIQFPHLFHKLFRVPELYAHLYCGGSLGLDYDPPARLAKGIVKEAEHLEDVHMSRRSSRRALSVERGRRLGDHRGIGEKVDVRGVVGTFMFSGDLTPFIPYLVLGRAFGVGKGRPWGLGRMTWWEEEPHPEEG